MVEGNEASFREAMETAKELVTKTRMAVDAKQMQLNEREAKIEDLKGRLNTCDSNKEFQLLKDRIAADTQANSVLQDEILELLERLDLVSETYKQAVENFEKSQKETRKITQQVQLEIEKLSLELERVTERLAVAEKGLPANLISEYRRLVAGKGEEALAETDSSTCGNCNQTLTTQTANELLMQRPMFCKGCGSLLYIVQRNPAGRSS